MYWLMVVLIRILISPLNPDNVDWSKHYPKVCGKEVTEDLFLNSKIIS
jgi:hypothetical protein